jgi:hypothetical protein
MPVTCNHEDAIRNVTPSAREIGIGLPSAAVADRANLRISGSIRLAPCAARPVMMVDGEVYRIDQHDIA